MQSTARRTLPGVDVSSFQGKPANWTKAAPNIKWAAVKITELEANGTRYVNPDAAADWNWLAHNKKGRIGYLFGHPSISAADTVNFFLTEMHKLGLHDKDGIALDIEVTDGLSAKAVNSWCVDVLSALHHQTSRKPLVYTFIDFAKAGNCASLGAYPLWLADPSSPAGHPRVPAPWSKWAIHQYNISGSIDRDVANFATLNAMTAALGKPAKPQEPPLQNLGGNVSNVTSARWPNGETVVAGLGADGFIQANRWNLVKWEGWKNVSPTPAKAGSSPSLTAWVSGHGRLYYVKESGEVAELATGDHGSTWT